jgi:hypothetical protein
MNRINTEKNGCCDEEEAEGVREETNEADEARDADAAERREEEGTRVEIRETAAAAEASGPGRRGSVCL